MLNSIDALTTRVENKINSHPTDFFSAVKCHSRPTNRIGLFHLDTRKAESNYLDVVIDEVRFNIAEERKEVAEIKQNKTTRASENKSNLYKLKEMLGKIAGKGGNKQEQEQRQEEEQKQNNNLKF